MAAGMKETISTPPTERAGSRTSSALATLLVALRWPIVLAVLGGAVAALVLLPPLTTRSGGIGDITTSDNPAIAAETRAAQAFGFPVLSRTVLVQRDPAGLPQPVLQKAYEAARSLHPDAAAAGGGTSGDVVAALPVVNAKGIVPGSRETGTTIVTFLYATTGDFGKATNGAQRYANQHFGPQDHVVGVTGTIPGRNRQTELLHAALPWLESVSVLAVILIVGFAFRSVVAPLLTIATAGISYVMITRVAALLAARLGVDIPPDLEPLMVALMLGVTTDYVVYFLAGMRGELTDGHARVTAARRSVATFAPIVAAAGLTVAAGVATLLVASTPAVRSFGPAMALSVLFALTVSLLFVPAVMGILGGKAFWPSVPRPHEDSSMGRTVRRAAVRVATTRAAAVVLVIVCVGGLGYAATFARGMSLGMPLVSALPSDTQEYRAQQAATQGFAAGVVAPTLVVVQGAGVGSDLTALTALEDLLKRVPHVAGVLGPQEDEALRQQAGRPLNLFVAAQKQTAQFVVVLDQEPLDGPAVATVDLLRDRLPALLARAGLPAATGAVGGDTAAVAAVVDRTAQDTGVIMLAALAVNLLILAVVLRALVAPVLLLLCTVLSVGATLGLTMLVFHERLRHPGLTFYVPLAAGVLLVSLGSDYNLFAVGHVWQEARRRSLREAMRVALPRSSVAITTAGLALAASLGSLALVPLRQFSELAFALGVGILLDTYVVRTLLVPSLLTVVGPASGWPGSRLRTPSEPAPQAEPGDQRAGGGPTTTGVAGPPR